MALIWNRKRSGGVPVTGAVHALIGKGNAARDRRDWQASAAFYDRALTIDPSLAHIWIQMGHSLKEAGDATSADAAYARAATLKPGSADPLIHRGHLAKAAGTLGTASRHYLAAFKLEPTNAEAATELHRLVARSEGPHRAALVEHLRQAVDGPAALPDPAAAARVALDTLLGDLARQGGRGRPGLEGHDGQDRRGLARADIDLLHEAASVLARIDAVQGAAPSPSGPAFVFDVSDLISYFGQARLPTGIQRVQIEAIGAAIQDPTRNARICCFVDGRDEWLELPAATFHRLAQLSVASGDRTDPVWMQALNELHLALALSDGFAFPQGANLVNLGTSWWLQNYFLYVRQAKERFGIRYIPMVYDLIPIRHPEFCVENLTRDFISWAVGVVAHADAFLAISEATRRDLIEVAATLGHAIDPECIAVVPLDADFRKPTTEPLPAHHLARWGLEPGKFVLFVGTVEARKGHTVALDAWSRLIRSHGAAKVPKLVCVGNRGWLNGDVYARLQDDKPLRDGTAMLSQLSDAELALLYRSCLFTIYPSLYEGWGLPVTEALCYGKAVITTTSSSLPEAGGDLALYVAPGSAAELAAAAASLIDDRAALGAREAAIAAYTPRSWADVAAQIGTDIVALAERTPPAPFHPPVARYGAYYPIARSTSLRIWPGLGSGEVFRAGTSWRAPDRDGCFVREGGAALAIALPGPAPVTAYFALEARRTGAVAWHLAIEGGPDRHGTLAAAERCWVRVDAAPGADGVLRATLAATRVAEDAPDPAADADPDGTADGDTVKLIGFYLHPADDAPAALPLLEAALLGTLDALSAYRRPEPAPALS